MASKWKYADLDANHRIGLLRKGNKELFDEEVARTKEVINARRELGLDTTEQESWMDTVGYNYNLSQADAGRTVSKTGYAQLYAGEKKADTEPSPVKKYRDGIPVVTGYISAANRKIDNALKLAQASLKSKYDDRKKEIYNELYDRYPYLKEQVLNEGASPDGGKMKRAYDSIEQELSRLYQELDNELSEGLSELGKKYAGLKDKIIEYRKNGTAKESLGVIADMLIKNAAAEDDFEYSSIPGVGSRTKVKALGSDTDNGTELSKAALELIARYPKRDDESTFEVSDNSDGISVRKEPASSRTLPEIEEFMKKIFNAGGDGAEMLGKIGEMLIRTGMSSNDVTRLAAEVIMRAFDRNSGK